MSEENKNQNDSVILAMFEAGAHFAYSRSKRHPSMKDVIFGVKNRVEIFDLEKTKVFFDKARNFIENVGASGKQVLFVSGKNEARVIVKAEAEALEAPYVAGRWLGGTLTNFGQMKTRMNRLVELREKKVKGELAKYTKKERLLIDRDILKLEDMFAGLLPMKEMPGAVFVIDSKKEGTVIAEAKKVHVPVVALLNSDCNLNDVNYPIPGNDAASSSIKFFVSEIAKAYKAGKARMIAPTAVAETVKNK